MQETVILTGAAGFIGSHTAKSLLDQGYKVIGIDNMNDYYDVTLKEARLAPLLKNQHFTFYKEGIENKEAIEAIFKKHADAAYVVHLAAQAGVRYSLTNPFAYIESNLMGHTVMMESSRQLKGLKHFVYASSSSVYGANTKIPFSIEDQVDEPLSLYAATKKSCEMIAHSYANVYKMPSTGLRFFTVYGPFGRPDMAAFIFADCIVKEKPIPLFNHGEMKRDFTYIDDIVSGIIAAMQRPAAENDKGIPHKVYNLGNHKSENLKDFVAILEAEFGRKAIINPLPMQVGDVPQTYADIAESQKDLGFSPKTPIAIGLKNFASWYKNYYKIN